MKIRLIQADTIEDFATLCESAIVDGFMFVGQLIITGLGKGEFMYTQQWAKGIEDALPQDKSE